MDFGSKNDEKTVRSNVEKSTNNFISNKDWKNFKENYWEMSIKFVRNKLFDEIVEKGLSDKSEDA
jgi:DNA-binding protein Fis